MNAKWIQIVRDKERVADICFVIMFSVHPAVVKLNIKVHNHHYISLLELITPILKKVSKELV